MVPSPEFKAFEPVFVKCTDVQMVTQQSWMYFVQGENGKKNRPKTCQPDETKTDRRGFERLDDDLQPTRQKNKNIGRRKRNCGNSGV